MTRIPAEPKRCSLAGRTGSLPGRPGLCRRPRLAAALTAALLATPPSVALLGALAPTARADDHAAARAAADRAIAGAVRFLAGAQNEDGSFGAIPGAPEPGEIGMTALVIRGLARMPEALRTEAGQRSLERALAWLLARQQPSGSFSPPGTGLATYRTALGITALLAVDPARYQDQVARARAFLAGSQFSEENGLEAEGRASPYYGGFGYDKVGAKPDADLSNTYLALEALREAGVPEDSEVWKRAVVFLQRCQNRSESNDQGNDAVVVRNDGGFMYDPALDATKSPVAARPDGKKEIPSYASMTYAGLLSMLNAHLARDDPRVQAAWAWIRGHYTLTENHGLGTRDNPRAAKQGLYYYYLVFAKTLAAWGEPVVVDQHGERHAWAEELCLHLEALQRKDGSWVNDEPRWWENDPVLVTGYVLGALDAAYPWLGRAANAEPGGGQGGRGTGGTPPSAPPARAEQPGGK